MRLSERLTRLEKHIGRACPLCRSDLNARAEIDERNRAEAEDLFSQYLAHCGRETAIELFSFDAPTLARSAGVLRKIERPGFCSSCYEDRRTREQIEADDRKSVREYLAAATDQGYRQADALNMLKEDAPHLWRFAA